jgi:hypothetical protein
LQVSKAAIFEIADYENIKLPKDPESKIPFWQRIGGKLVLLGILLVYLFVQFNPFKRKPESTPAPVPTNKENNASGSAS